MSKRYSFILFVCARWGFWRFCSLSRVMTKAGFLTFGVFLLVLTLSGCASDCVDSMPDSFDKILSQHRDPEGPGVSAIVVKGGKAVFRKSYGMADVEGKIPLDPTMPHLIGSLTKPFTAAAIMLLSEEGKLSVADDVRVYLPDYPTHGKGITVEHLLTHTSGIRDYFDLPGFRKDLDRDMPLSELIDTFKSEPLEFEPGSAFAYSNSGYILLGAIIERVSGQPYCAFMRQRIFEPLGMADTQCAGSRLSGVVGYSRSTIAKPVSMTKTYAAGALQSTVDDLAKWNAAIDSGRLLEQETWGKVFTPFMLLDGEKTETGYGWGIGNLQDHPAVGHEGKIHGFSSMMIRLPENDVFVAVLSNDDRLELLTEIESWFFDASPACLSVQLALTALEEE